MLPGDPNAQPDVRIAGLKPGELNRGQSWPVALSQDAHYRGLEAKGSGSAQGSDCSSATRQRTVLPALSLPWLWPVLTIPSPDLTAGFPGELQDTEVGTMGKQRFSVSMSQTLHRTHLEIICRFPEIQVASGTLHFYVLNLAASQSAPPEAPLSVRQVW